ncbi:glycosyltransferase family protein [Bradyrhizobium sp.]|uniref:glycosyltransferase family protein n=1 Tax=Bradyrhizobium sp. TaxID=376 RepID=UPI002DFA0AA5|nr:glycosyltransferase [Bradyrhizobium sp.]
MSERFTALVLHPHRMMGENQAVWYQTVDYPIRLFADDADWQIYALGANDPGAPEAALACDLLLIHMLATPELETLIALRQAQGRPIVYEISDNILALGGWLPSAHALRSPLVRQQILRYAAICDGLQTYSPGVAEAFGPVARRVSVVDYSLPDVPEHMPEKPEGFVFGWAGTTSHRADLLVLSPVVTEFCRRHTESTFAFMGDRQLLDECFAGIPPRQIDYRPFGPHPDYLQFVRGWHVGIAPAEDTPFNRGRSDGKFVEYAAVGAVPLLSDIPIYRPHADRAALFKHPGDLAAALERLHSDPDARNALARRAHQWVRTNRTGEAGRTARKQFYGSLVRPSALPTRNRIRPPAPRLAAGLEDALEAFRHQDHERALRLCRELLRARPDFAQAVWLAAVSLEALGRDAELLEGIDGNLPTPVYADLHAELRYHAALRSRPAEAGGHLDRIRSPLRRLRLRARESHDKRQFYADVLRHSPYDFFALFALIRLLTLDEGVDSAELASLWARACFVAPERVPHSRRHPRLAPFLPR